MKEYIVVFRDPLQYPINYTFLDNYNFAFNLFINCPDYAFKTTLEYRSPFKPFKPLILPPSIFLRNPLDYHLKPLKLLIKPYSILKKS